MPNKAPHRTAIPLRSVADCELGRWNVPGCHGPGIAAQLRQPMNISSQDCSSIANSGSCWAVLADSKLLRCHGAPEDAP